MHRPALSAPLSVLTLILCLFAVSNVKANTIWVSTLIDDNSPGGGCSLREAIISANLDTPTGGCLGGSGTDDISFIEAVNFPARVGTINLTSPLPEITSAVNILGNGANLNTVAGNNTFRLLSLAPPENAKVKITGISFTGGRQTAGGNAAAIDYTNGAMGSGLTLEKCEFYGNSGAGSGSGDGSNTFFVSGITLIVLDGSTFRNNSTENVIKTANSPFFQIMNITISDNTGSGAGIYISQIASGWTIANSTITRNNVGIWHANTNIESNVKIKGSIFSENPSGNLKRTPNTCPATTNNIVSDGYNIFDDDPGSSLCAPAATDMTNTDPKLGPLAINGGSVRARAPLYGSPAIDKIPGPSGTNFPMRDQRFTIRPQHGTADIGAVEFTGYVANANSSGDFSLKDALANAPADATIEFDPDFFSLPRTIVVTQTMLFRFRGVTVNGPGADRLTITGNGIPVFMVFETAETDVVNLNGISFTGASGTFPEGYGMIEMRNSSSSDAGTLNINGCEFYGNGTAAAPFDIIHSRWARRVSLNSSTIRDNFIKSAINGDRTPVDVINSTISGNIGTGAAVRTSGTGTSSIISSTISGNSQGIWNETGSGISTVDLKNTILSRNGGQNLKRTGIASCNPIVTSGHNLIDDETWSQLVNSDATDLKGASFDARLAPIGNYGGTTSTHALKAGSAAIDAGTSVGVPPVDQRGMPRVIGAAADIGSFERNVTFDQATVPNGRANFAYNNGTPFQLTATRHTAFTAMKGAHPVTIEAGNPTSFALVPAPGQSFPPGLNLSPDGTISGTPTTGGNYTFTVKATDTDGVAGAAQFTMLVLAPPTAAHVSISGRVTDGAGRSLARTTVIITDMSGASRSALTNSFGYYRFDEVRAGETYIFNAMSKGYRFDPRVVNVGGDLTGLDFTPR
jgi:CSLREA domain-containing protein